MASSDRGGSLNEAVECDGWAVERSGRTVRGTVAAALTSGPCICCPRGQHGPHLMGTTRPGDRQTGAGAGRWAGRRTGTGTGAGSRWHTTEAPLASGRRMVSKPCTGPQRISVQPRPLRRSWHWTGLLGRRCNSQQPAVQHGRSGCNRGQPAVQQDRTSPPPGRPSLMPSLQYVVQYRSPPSPLLFFPPEEGSCHFRSLSAIVWARGG